MKKMWKEITAFLSLLLVVIIIIRDSNTTFETGKYAFHTKAGTFEYTLYEAKTASQKSQGLQNITMLPLDHGMIFFFGNNSKPSFWMKDTFISLDLIYLDNDMKVIEIKPNQPPLSEELIYPTHVTKYVVELTKGSSKRIGLTVGDLLTKL